MQSIILPYLCERWLNSQGKHFQGVNVSKLHLSCKDVEWMTLLKNHELLDKSRKVNIIFQPHHQNAFYDLCASPDFAATRKVTLLQLLVKGLRNPDTPFDVPGTPYKQLQISHENQLPAEAKAIFGNNLWIDPGKDVQFEHLPKQESYSHKKGIIRDSATIEMFENQYIGQFHCTATLRGDVVFDGFWDSINIGQIVRDLKVKNQLRLEAIDVFYKINDYGFSVPDGIEWRMSGNCELTWISNIEIMSNDAT
ncbi:hypothetical protein Bpfe_017175 [Biomphalaria pfeifferi]|uniref:Uncharacterized protein n=1 Tax=Biomphalaria pfeifferi TaxID=112525 RepID=A0AAD8F6F3_BIOPF|nr:hypothetical protein Bpfe_017175 [Biomphalaria pfeifferi]